MQGITLLHLKRGLYHKNPYIKQSKIQWICSWLKWMFFGAPSTCVKSYRYHASEIFGTISVTRIFWVLDLGISRSYSLQQHANNLNTNDFSHFLFTNFEGVWISQSNNISQASGESKFFFAKRRGECNVSHTFISYAWWTETVMKTAWPTVPHQYYWAFMKTW